MRKLFKHIHLSFSTDKEYYALEARLNQVVGIYPKGEFMRHLIDIAVHDEKILKKVKGRLNAGS